LKLVDVIVINRIDVLCSKMAMLGWLRQVPHMTSPIPQDKQVLSGPTTMGDAPRKGSAALSRPQLPAAPFPSCSGGRDAVEAI
jgi:hypothetical protein